MATLLEQVIARLRQLPETQQDLVAAQMQTFVELIDLSRLQLSDEQVAEVDRRKAVANPPTVTLTELDAHLARLLKGL